jgi:hypothetical protein
MNNSRNIAVLGLVVWTLIAGLAAADDKTRGSRKGLDSDSDGFVTKADWDAGERRGKAEFSDLDTDGDERISQDEMADWRRKNGRDRVRNSRK